MAFRTTTLIALALLGSCAAAAPAPVAPAVKPSVPPTGTPVGVDAAAAFYDTETIVDVALEISDADIAAMEAALPERIEVPVRMSFGDAVVENASIRFKGNSSSPPVPGWKRGLLVDTDAYVPGQEFLGLEHVAFDAGIQFGGLYSEILINEALRARGVVASRANHARLTLNGAFLGVFVNVERIDKKFLRKHFASNDGNLYKVDLGGPGADLADQGDDASAYAQAFEKKTNEAAADWSDVASLARLLRDAPDATFADDLGAVFEVEPFVRSMAVMVLSGAFDQYTGWNAHNYYLYFDEGTGRASYIAHDLDVGFADDAFGAIPVIDGWNASYPLPQTPRPLVARILANPKLRAAYRTALEETREGVLAPEALKARLQTMFDHIAPDIAREAFSPGRVTVPSDTDAESVVSSLSAFIDERFAKAQAEVDDPIDVPPPRTVTDRPQSDGPRPGDLAEGAPSDLVGEATEGGVALSWTAGGGAVIAHIIQRCTGDGCTAFANHIGVEVGEGNKAVDQGALAPGTYRYRVYAMVAVDGAPAGTLPSAPIDVVIP